MEERKSSREGKAACSRRKSLLVEVERCGSKSYMAFRRPTQWRIRAKIDARDGTFGYPQSNKHEKSLVMPCSRRFLVNSIALGYTDLHRRHSICLYRRPVPTVVGTKDRCRK